MNQPRPTPGAIHAPQVEEARKELYDLIDSFENERSIGNCVEVLLDMTYDNLLFQAGLSSDRIVKPSTNVSLREANLEELYTSFQIIKFLVNVHVAYDRISHLEYQNEATR